MTDDADVAVTVTRTKDGYVTIDLTIGEGTFYIEVGRTKYSAYLAGVCAETKFFEGVADAAEDA